MSDLNYQSRITSHQSPIMKKILLTAYAVNPYKGSEDGTAWNMITQIAKHHKVIAITRENNQEAIDKYLKENELEGSENLEFAYFDLPYWMRFWKKGGQGALLYFYMWQVGIVSFISSNKLEFDIAHNLNFHSDWTPTFLWRLGKPVVWGPVGHHHKIPDQYLAPVYSKKERFMDTLKWWTKLFFWNLDPFLGIAKRKAYKILAINSSVVDMMRLKADKAVIIPAVGSEPMNQDFTKSDTQFNVLSIGRFVPLKGFDITVKAFAQFYKTLSDTDKANAKLILVGKGPYQKALQKMVEAEGVTEGVQFINWIERAKLKSIYESAHLFFFPSHEGAGMVVPEALSFRVPILCFDNYGPGEFINEECGFKIPYTEYEKSINEFAKHLQLIYQDKTLQKKLQQGAINRYQEQFDWNIKGNQISAIYEEIS